MKERLSELMDNEIADGAVPDVVDALATEPELQQTWEAFRFASDALRAHLTEPPVDVVGSVMAAIAKPEAGVTAIEATSGPALVRKKSLSL